jgi:type IV pilus assembly protein PilQ
VHLRLLDQPLIHKMCIYEQTERNDVDKVPFFGDLPIIGNAFKHRTKQDDKTELLIFVTPKIMDESLGLR